MKLLRLLALTIAATAWCVTAAAACDGAKNASAGAASCGSKTTTAAAHPGCSMSGKTTAVTASAGKAAGCAASAACPMSAEQCKAMEASGACTAQTKAACAAHGAKGAKTAAHQCDAHGTMAALGDCVVCSDEMECDDEVKATGARMQVVSLRNGTMIVYTVDNHENVRAIQAAVARHNHGVVAALQGDSKLCPACKKLRGALASGKLVREVVNVERGCQILITSSDRAIAQQVRSCASAQVAARAKM